MPTQTKIKSISVENVRGISSAKFVFDTPEMLGNKFHVLVAPNGFGKSSLAGAFSSLKPRSLKLPPALHHKDDETNKAKLEIIYTIDGVDTTVKADEGSNDISKIFSVAVINSRLKPHAVANQFARATASLIIEPIILVESIPKRPATSFSTTAFRQALGTAGKVLPNIQSFLENDLVLNGILSSPDVGRFAQKTVWKKIDPIIGDIKTQKGTVAQIVAWLEGNKLTEFRAIPELATIANLLADFSGLSETERFLVAYQFAKAYQENAKLLNDNYVWRSYLSGKQRCDEFLASVNSNPAWIAVSVKEKKREIGGGVSSGDKNVKWSA